jgi:pyrimidine and pyridine-specific 5'-nucleotidase
MSQAMKQAGVQDSAKCLFVDDSLGNVEGAKRVGWSRSVYFRERGPETVEALRINHTAGDQEKLLAKDGMPTINDLQQLREVWPDVFVQAEQ